ncbi:MAG: ABC transporter permease [Trueperaceae bacterium]|nr:MAG: ABC transporter permease [Trueperaceae bacterium]
MVLSYVLRRLVQMIPTFLGATLLAFLIIQAAPGDFTDRFALDPNIDPEQLQRMRERFALDQPVMVQYANWMWSIVRFGYLGESFSYRAPVNAVIYPLVLNSMSLVLVSLVLTYLLTIPIAVYSAVRQYSLGDKVVTFLSFLGLAIPNFFFILILITGVLFLQPSLRQVAAQGGTAEQVLRPITYDLDRGLVFPVGGMRTSQRVEQMSSWERFKDRVWHLVLPVIVVTTASLASLVRVLRGQMLEFLRSDFVRTAAAKGVPPRGVVYKHALRNALNPLISGIGTLLPSLVGGAGLVEFVIRWPGITPAFVAAVKAQDLYIVMGLLTVSAVLLMIGNFLSDVLLGLVDPRIRYT